MKEFAYEQLQDILGALSEDELAYYAAIGMDKLFGSVEQGLKVNAEAVRECGNCFKDGCEECSDFSQEQYIKMIQGK